MSCLDSIFAVGASGATLVECDSQNLVFAALLDVGIEEFKALAFVLASLRIDERLNLPECC